MGELDICYIREQCTKPEDECQVKNFLKNFKRGLSIGEVKDICLGMEFVPGDREFITTFAEGVIKGIDDAVLVFDCTKGLPINMTQGTCGSLLVSNPEEACNESIVMGVEAVKARWLNEHISYTAYKG